MTTLPTTINPGDTGHISHHDIIHGLLNPIIDLDNFEIAPQSSGTWAVMNALTPDNGLNFYATDQRVSYRANGTAWRMVGLQPDEASPYEYGAVADGTTDDAAAITAAIAAAGVGGRVRFAPGLTYAATTSVVPLDGQQWRGWKTVILRIGASTAPVIDATSVSGFDMRGIIADGASTTANAVRLTTCDDVELGDVTCQNATARGLNTTSCTGLRLHRTKGDSNGGGGGLDAGLFLHGTDIAASQCSATGNDGHGIVLFGTTASPSSDCRLSSTRVTSNTQHGFTTSCEVGTYIEDLQVSDMRAESNGASALYSGASFDKVSGLIAHVIARDNAEHGIVVQDSEHVSVSGVAVGNGVFGLRIQGDYSRAEDAQTGVHYGSFTGLSIRDNGTTSNANYGGIYISENCFDLAIVGNSIVGNTGVGVRFTTRASYTDPHDIAVDRNWLNDNSFSDAISTNLPSTTTTTIVGQNWVTGLLRRTIDVSDETVSYGNRPVDWTSFTSGTVTLPDGGTFFNVALTTGTAITLDTLTGGYDGREVMFRFGHSSSGGTSVTIRHLGGGTGNIKLVGKTQFVTTNSDFVRMVYLGGFWHAYVAVDF